MAIEVPTLYEPERGCGYRKEGGIYLMSGGISRACGRLPIPCDICPCCGGGIKPSRSWTWVDADALFLQYPCKTPEVTETRKAGFFGVEHKDCPSCPAGQSLGKAGLLWIGGKYYPTKESWIRESEKMGVSRRLPHVPKELEIGKTWVLVVHRQGIERTCDCVKVRGEGLEEGTSSDPECEKCKGGGEVHVPAIFHMFKPIKVEYVVKGDETEEDLEALVKRGLTPVRVKRLEDQPNLDLSKVELD